jgi:hypothetical protein
MRARDFALPAYRFLRDQASALATLALPAIVVIVVGNLLPGFAGGGYGLVMIVSNLVGWLVLAQFARVVIGGLLESRAPSTAELLRPDRRSWSVLWRSVVAVVIAILPAAVLGAVALILALAHAFGGRSGPDEEWYFLLLLPPGLLASCWLAARLVLVPVTAVATEVGSPFATAWSLTRGHVWLALKLLALTILPFLLAAWLATALWSGMIYSLGLFVAVIGGIFAAVLHLAMMVVYSRALVGLYRALASAAKP